jgi:uncharacterized protein YerC
MYQTTQTYMTKLSRRALPKEFGDYVNNLWSAFTLLDSKSDIRLLFKDLFTHTEYKMFAKRLEIARRLESGQTYEEIKTGLSVTSGTISTVSNTLMEQGDGFRKAHQKLTEAEVRQEKARTEKTKNVMHPLRKKIKRRPVFGLVLKAGVQALDIELRKRSKARSATKKFEI